MTHKLEVAEGMRTVARRGRDQRVLRCWNTTVAGAAVLVHVLVLGLAAAPVTHAASNPLARTDYASIPALTNDYKFWKEQVKSSTRILYEGDPAGQRGVVQRIEVQPGDTNVYGSGDGERAEVLAPGALGGFRDVQTLVMSWSTFIGADFESPPGKWNNFVQIHAAGGSNFSPWQLNLVGAKAELAMRLFGGGDWNPSKQPVDAVQEWLPLGELAKNRWNDFVIEVRFGCTGKGYARIWLNGKRLVDAQNRKIGYCGDPGMYWKQGFYRSAYSKATRLYFDDTFRWGATADAFANYGWKLE